MKKIFKIVIFLMLLTGIFLLVTKKIKLKSLKTKNNKNNKIITKAVKDPYDSKVSKTFVNGKWIITNNSKSFDFIDTFYEGLAVVALNEKYGFINKKSDIIIPIKYDLATHFNNGYAIVKFGNKYGAIDKKGNEIIKPNYYDYMTNFDINGIARVKNTKDKKDLAIDAKGRIVKNFNKK